MPELCRPPRRGTWIEIQFVHNFLSLTYCRPPRRGTWIEIKSSSQKRTTKQVVPRVGGRGLNYLQIYGLKIMLKSSPA